MDASVALSAVLGDEQDEATEHALQLLRDDFAVVPHVWIFEVTNGLLTAERDGRLTSEMFSQARDDLSRLPVATVDLDLGEAIERIVPLARSFRLTAYDASYLALAHGDNLSFATLDRRLARAARALGIPLVE